MPEWEIHIDDAELQRALERFGQRALDGRKPLRQFYGDWKARVGLLWGQVKATGGIFRGDAWKPMKEQRPGVPAWGGTPKKSGGGVTLGRKRPSGQRVRSTSVMNQDTGNLRNVIMASAPDVTPQRLRIAGDLGTAREYAYHVLADYGRNPVKFFTEDDQALQRRAREYFDELAREFNA